MLLSDFSTQLETEIHNLDFNKSLPEAALPSIKPIQDPLSIQPIQTPSENDRLQLSRPSCSHWNNVDTININKEQIISPSQLNQNNPMSNQEQVASPPLMNSFEKLNPNKNISKEATSVINLFSNKLIEYQFQYKIKNPISNSVDLSLNEGKKKQTIARLKQETYGEVLTTNSVLERLKKAQEENLSN